jgi:hypothetical protein
MGTLSLLDLCEVGLDSIAGPTASLDKASTLQTRGIHITNFATGCIYNYDATHVENLPGNL